MNWKFALILIFFTHNLFAGNEDTLKIYTWEDAQKADPLKVYGIKFNKLKLENVPEDLQKYTNLRVLDLSKNKLSTLPNFINTFAQLKEINLYKNKFINFPVELCGAKSLEKITISSNYFASIPSCFTNLQHLKYIDLSDNPISDFPAVFDEMKNVKRIEINGILFNAKTQEMWNRRLPWIKIGFDAPCNCLN